MSAAAAPQGKEEVFQFLEQVLTEVIDLFPYQYIHIGGDECPKARWEQCPLCQKRMMEVRQPGMLGLCGWQLLMRMHELGASSM